MPAIEASTSRLKSWQAAGDRLRCSDDCGGGKVVELAFCNGAQAQRESGQTIAKMVGAIGFESETKRKLNNLERSRRHVIPCFRCSAVRTACKRHGPLTRRNSWPRTQYMLVAIFRIDPGRSAAILL